MKRVIKEAAVTTIGVMHGQRIRKPWITTEMLDRMEERRKWKNVNTEEGRRNYKSLNNSLRRETDKAREIWWREQCTELEHLDNAGRSDLLYRKVREISKRTNRKIMVGIRDKEGTYLNEPSKVCERWKEYIEELYDKEGKPAEEENKIEAENDVEREEKGADIMYEEFERALEDLKSGKTAGIDNIPAELLKAMGQRGKQELYEICKEIYSKGDWPEEFTESIIVPIEKKKGAKECVDFRTISLVTHASKIVLRMLTRRMESKAEVFLGPDQFGFRRDRGTRDGIGALRTLYERSLEHNNKVYICYVDYEKAFDRVNWVKMMEILLDIGVDWRDRRLIWNLYNKQTAYVRIGENLSEGCVIGRGVRQGCSLSPLLFIIYDEALTREAISKVEKGVKVGGEMIKAIRYADDKAIVSSTKAGLQVLMDNLNDITKKYGMKINVKKTKVMCISRKKVVGLKILIDGQLVEQVSQFKYLGSLISEDGYCKADIKSRIAQGKCAFMERKGILTGSMKVELKIRMIKCLVWTVATYAAECWTMTGEDRKRIEAFEMWTLRRMLKISWRDKITNQAVLERAGVQRELLRSINRRKHRWLGHTLRGEGMLVSLLEGRMQGKTTRGRRRLNMMSDLDKGETYGHTKRKAQDRAGWRRMEGNTRASMSQTCSTAED